MTDTVPTTYIAQIILALPGRDESATITVTLAPTDEIPVGARLKPLADCTLAELRTFANTLEADVWKTYDAITLHELQTKNELAIKIRPLESDVAPEQPDGDWLKQAIVFPEEDRRAEPAKSKAASRPAAKPVPPAETPGQSGDQPAEAKAPEPQSGEVAPVAEPSAAASQPVAPVADTAPPAFMEKPAPTIIAPSKARVRVAGARLPLQASRGAAVDIFMDETALRAMQAHALSSLDREVAGVVVGQRPEKQPDGRYVVHIIDSIVAKHTVMHGASVTYTPESWRYMNDALWERYPDESALMVGWYHTHPGFGIFLSGMDLFIHQNFFTQVWHIAYVLDPRARTSGFFCWNKAKTKVDRYDFQWPSWASGSW